MSRRYQQRQRADQQEQTRRRITAAAVALHGTVGPAATTISAIAELAGVQRATVYRHFPDDESLFQACTAHFFATNPPPDPTGWRDVRPADARLTRALTEVYGWYERTEPMLANITRDAEAMPHLVGRGYAALISRLSEALLPSVGPIPPQLRAAVNHALHFRTWRSLARDQQLAPGEAVELMTKLASVAAEPAARQRGRRERPTTDVDPARGA